MVIIPLQLIITFCGCKKNLTSEVDTGDLSLGYPTILTPLSTAQIKHLQNEFDSLNNFKICSKIDKYGFTGDETYTRPFQMIPFDKDSAIELAVTTLLKNSKYTKVKDRVAIISNGYEVRQLDTEGIRWLIIFNPQHYYGYEIPFSRIYVLIYGNEAYAITGHWYSNIYIPSQFNIEKEKAKQKVVGEKITWNDFGGTPHEFIVTTESVSDTISGVVFPVEKDNSIEMRVTWMIPIFFSDGGGIGWHIYIDVITGDIVQISQEFLT